MFLRLTGVVTALFLSTSLAQAAMDPYALGQDYIDQGYTQVEVKVGTSIIKVEAVKERNRYEFTYNVQTGEMVKSESAPLELATRFSAGEGNDDHSSSGSSDDDKSSDDHGSDHHDSEDDHGSDHSGSDDSGDDD